MNQDGSNRVPFDLRTEIGLAHDVRRQTVPVLVNECIVRAFYRIILRDWDNNYYEVDYNGNLLVFKN